MSDDHDQIAALQVLPLAVSAEAYDWLCEQLDAPPAPAPRLCALMKEAPVWARSADERPDGAQK